MSIPSTTARPPVAPYGGARGPAAPGGATAPAGPAASASPSSPAQGAARKFESLEKAREAAKTLPAEAFKPVDGGYVLDSQRVSDFVLDVVPEFFSPAESGPLSESGLQQQALAIHQDAEGDTKATSFFTENAMYTKLEIGSLNKSVWFQRNYDAPRIDLGELLAQMSPPDQSSFSAAGGQPPAPTSLSTPATAAAERISQKEVF